MAAAVWARDRAAHFYLGMAWTGAAAAAAGFSTTYFIPLATGRLAVPAIAHVHGLLFFSWIALLVAQAFLVRTGRTRLHRRIGWAAVPLALAMAASGMGVGIHAVGRDLAVIGEASYSQLVGVVTSMAFLLAYVGIAIAMRKRPDWHKRMILLATIAILWPAWFRFRHFLPWIPNPDILLAVVLADSLVAAAMIRDRLVLGRVHPAYWIFGTALVGEHVLEAVFYDTAPWRASAKTIYLALT
jgi:hypothetical protein